MDRKAKQDLTFGFTIKPPVTRHTMCLGHKPPVTRHTTCLGHKPNGELCKIWWGLDAHGYCRHHAWQQLPICKGFKIGTQQRCSKRAKPNYAYCCAEHDPSIPRIAPSVLDPQYLNLRRRVQNAVVAHWDGQDVYNQEQLDLKTPYALDLDHIVEKQCFTFAISKLNLREGDDDFALATEVLRESVVNELGNLTLTRPITNRVKGSGVYNYLDDSRTGHLGQKNFTSYLQAAKCDGKKLTRDNTRRITRNMGKSMKICQRKLHDEGDTRVLHKLSKQMQQLYVDMELKASK